MIFLLLFSKLDKIAEYCELSNCESIIGQFNRMNCGFFAGTSLFSYFWGSNKKALTWVKAL
jgi:hypothetical protein